VRQGLRSTAHGAIAPLYFRGLRRSGMKLWIAVCALPVARLDTAALQARVLAGAAITGLYSLNPAVPV
jgi:hypothetical protein